MIISASRRTDIPAFYANWFLQRIESGYCLVANPFNPTQVRKVSLAQEDIDAVVFWTKYSGPLRARLPQLDAAGIPYYFLYTLTRYGRNLEARVPPVEKLLDDLLALSYQIGSHRIVWRYDPIIISREFSFQRHLEIFELLATALRGATHRIIISFIDYYAKTRKNMARYLNQFGPPIEHPEKIEGFEDFIVSLVSISANNNMEIQSCAETISLERLGVAKGKCIDDNLIQRALGIKVTSRKDTGQRRECACVKSIDIGTYNTCVHGCSYCYATQNHRVASQNYRRIRPDDPTLNKGIHPTQGK